LSSDINNVSACSSDIFFAARVCVSEFLRVEATFDGSDGREHPTWSIAKKSSDATRIGVTDVPIIGVSRCNDRQLFFRLLLAVAGIPLGQLHNDYCTHNKSGLP
jgi:hypothetical protein